MERDLSVARLLARIAGRSLPIRGSTLLARDHPNPIGLAPIRRAGDGRLQAVAYGSLPGPPTLAALVDPLSLTDPGLDHLGAVLDQRLHDPEGAQVWIPDEPSFLALKIEGIRSRTNPHCSPLRRRLGGCLHALARLEPLAGQQVVDIATDVLGNHLVTGQSPTEDAHLAARLAWDDPLPGLSPAQVAANRRCHPGPSLLTVEEDERVETLRVRLRRGGSARDREEILYIVTGAAAASWELLVQAWTVFQHLPLPALPRLDELETDSAKELGWLLGSAPSVTQHLGRACAEFSKREYWRARLEHLEAQGDPVTREVRRREGRVILATTLRRQDRWLILATTQHVLRLRSGTRLTIEDGRIGVVVVRIHVRRGKTILLVRITRGIRAAAALPLGGRQDWVDTGVFRGKPGGRTGLTQLAGIPPAEALSPLPVPVDLVRYARGLRQP